MTQRGMPELWRDGLLRSNPALVQLLGLCPLLAVSNTAINGLSLGAVTLAVLVLSNTLISCLRRLIPAMIRLPAFVLLIATLVTFAEMLMQAFSPALHQALGIFVPLIVTNCLLMARAESFASRNPVSHALVDGFAQGSGFLWVLFCLGSLREILGEGHWLAGAEQLFGAEAKSWSVQIFASPPLLIAVLPAGAFLALGVLIALRNLIVGARDAS